ncbi:MAG: hypothetical protein R2879_03760 [Saprospiraceae bacterium]
MNRSITKPIFTVVLALISSFSMLVAQSTRMECIDLERMDPAQVFGRAQQTAIGATIYTEQDVALKYNSYKDLIGVTYAGTLAADAGNNYPGFYHGVKNVLDIQDATVQFDFTQKTDDIYIVQMYFFDYNDEGYNLKINNGALYNVSDITQVPSTMGQGLEFSFQTYNPVQGSTIPLARGGVLTISSQDPIDSLTFGGTRVLIDNICISPDKPGDCLISNLLAVPICNVASDEFMVALSFDNALPDQGSIQISGNGTNYGIFQYIAGQPIVLGPFSYLTQATLEFEVGMNGSNVCGWSTSIRTNDCASNPPPPICELDDLTVTANLCDEDGELWIDLDLLHYNTSDSFDVLLNNNINLGTHAYADLPISVGPVSAAALGNLTLATGLVTVSDHDNPACSTQEDFRRIILCGQHCNLNTLKVDTVICSPTSFDITFNVDASAALEDSFALFIANQSFGFHAYADLPITVENVPHLGATMLPLTLIEADTNVLQLLTDTCQITTYFETGCADCQAENLRTLIDRFDPASGDYTLLVNLDYTIDTLARFQLSIDGNVVDTFRYGQLPIDLNMNCAQTGDTVSVTLCDLDLAGCCFEADYLNPCLPAPCDLPDFDAVSTNCRNGLYDLVIEFDANAQTSVQALDIYVNGIFAGYFVYQNRIVIPELPVVAGNIIEINICENDNPNCCITKAIPNSCPPCNIRDLTARALPCDADGNFNILVDFIWSNQASNGFEIVVNGQTFGPYTYNNSNPPVSVGPFDSQSANSFALLVKDISFAGCVEDIVIPSPNCAGQCLLSDLVLEASDCNNNEFSIDLDFNNLNTSDSFSLKINGDVIGHFAYADLFLTLNGFTGNGQNLEFLIQDLDNPDCRLVGEITAPLCNPNPCSIRDLNISATNCNPNGVFGLEVNFIHDNTSDSFQIKVNGDIIGMYAYADLPFTTGSFIGNGQNLEIIIQDKNNPDCRGRVELTAPDCNPANCRLTDLVVEAGDCDNDGNFMVDIDLNHQNTSDSFKVFVNGVYYATYAYADLFVTAGPFVGNGNNYQFIIEDKDNPDCRIDKRMTAPNCNPNACSLRDLVVEKSDCDNDGSFTVDIDFIHQNTSDSFKLFVNGNYYETYAYANLFVTAGPFTGNGNVYTFLIQDNDNPDCAIDKQINAPDCNNAACNIWDLVVEAGDCDANDEFTFDLDFNHVNTSDSFALYINGDFQGNFAYADLFLTLGPIPEWDKTLSSRCRI